MAKSVNVNYTDTTGGATHGITIPSVNFGADFRAKKEQVGEIVLTNMTSPLGLPEQIEFYSSEVPDVYAGTSVDRALMAPSRKGIKFIAKLRDTYTVTDDTDTSYEIALPMEAHLVCKVAANANLTTEMVVAFISRFLAGLFETDDTTMNNRIDALLHMSVKPEDL